MFWIVIFVSIFDVIHCASPFCKYKCGKKFNNCCAYTENHPGSACEDFDVQKLSDDDRDVVLNSFNVIRNIVAAGEWPRKDLKNITSSNMNALSYSKELEQTAKCWAFQCRFGHSRCKKSSFGLLGETVCKVSGSAKKLAELSADLLVSCPSFYFTSYENFTIQVIDEMQYPENQDTERISETFQLLWAETKYMGCYRVSWKFTAETAIAMMVCHFAPKGCIQNAPIFLRGKPCAKCPNDCNDNYTNLCGTIRPMALDKFVMPQAATAVKIQLSVLTFVSIIEFIL